MTKVLFALFCTVAVVLVCQCQSTRYDGYKVFRVSFQTEEQFNMLFRMHMNPPKGVMFWQLSHAEHYADIMVAPYSTLPFLEMLNSYGFTYRLVTDNVQNSIDSGN